jgi:cysteinyl-tRNA synthetase
MSKSLGNFFTVREAAAAYGYESIRMFMLMSHYRSPLNYSGDILIQAKGALERMKTLLDNLRFLHDNGGDSLSASEAAFVAALPSYRDRFVEALDDDFNTADGVAVIFELVREANARTASDKTPSKALAGEILKVFEELTGVLGLFYGEDENKSLAEEVEALIAARQAARKDKNWAEADRIRDRIKELGILLEDTPQGVKYHFQK